MLRILAALIFVGISATAQTKPQGGGISITLDRRGNPMDFSLPQYKLTLEGDGSVLFEGKSHVSAMRMHRRKIQPAVVTDLAHRFEAIGYFDFPRHLGACTDATVVVTTASIGGRSNEVSDWECGNNDSLNKLEDDIDIAANSKVWVRGRTRLWLHWPWFHS